VAPFLAPTPAPARKTRARETRQSAIRYPRHAGTLRERRDSLVKGRADTMQQEREHQERQVAAVMTA
jgi:hypothetical protein